MPRQRRKSSAWFISVYKLVQQIPSGKVTTYRHLAELLGKEARHVGQGLKWLPAADSGEDYHVDNVPWYRVVNSNEIIAHRSPGSQVKQTEKLEEEGIAVQRGFRHLWVEFRLCGWFPSKDEIAVGDGEEEDADGEEEEEDGNDEDSEEDGEWEPE